MLAIRVPPQLQMAFVCVLETATAAVAAAGVVVVAGGATTGPVVPGPSLSLSLQRADAMPDDESSNQSELAVNWHATRRLVIIGLESHHRVPSPLPALLLLLLSSSSSSSSLVRLIVIPIYYWVEVTETGSVPVDSCPTV